MRSETSVFEHNPGKWSKLLVKLTLVLVLGKEFFKRTGVVAVLVFVILVAAFMLGRYLARHKGDYKTNEEKGDGEDADTALQNGDPNHPAVKKNKEWFI